MLQDISEDMPPGTSAWNGDGSVASAPSNPMLGRIAELCVGAFADVCAIYLRAQGALPAAFATRDAERWATLAYAPYDESYQSTAVSCGVVSIIGEPLVIDNRVLGTLVLGFAESSSMPDARNAITAMSPIIAMALQQAQELAHHYHVSKRLQKALLPARLARVEGLEFDAAYRPASDEAEVGGDWYDAFEIGNGTIGISVGDVTGHGLEAAVAMSEIARAIRSAAASTTSPSALLNYVDAFVSSQGVALATAIAGIYDPKTRVLRYASAGHPHPVLVTPGDRAIFLPGGGTVLGLGIAQASPDWTVTLTPGTICYLYTDGLVEYGRDFAEGERTLLETLQRLASGDDRSAGALLNAIFTDTNNNDDVATLAMRNLDVSTNPSLRLVYSAIPASAPLAREALRHYLRGQEIHEERRFDILAAVGEAVGNAIEHGAQEPGSSFDVDLHNGGNTLVIRVENRGHWKAFTPRPERGRGMPIMRGCSDGVEVASTREHTSVTLTFITGE